MIDLVSDEDDDRSQQCDTGRGAAAKDVMATSFNATQVVELRQKIGHVSDQLDRCTSAISKLREEERQLKRTKADLEQELSDSRLQSSVQPNEGGGFHSLFCCMCRSDRGPLIVLCVCKIRRLSTKRFGQRILNGARRHCMPCQKCLGSRLVSGLLESCHHRFRDKIHGQWHRYH